MKKAGLYGLLGLCHVLLVWGLTALHEHREAKLVDRLETLSNIDGNLVAVLDGIERLDLPDLAQVQQLQSQMREVLDFIEPPAPPVPADVDDAPPPPAPSVYGIGRGYYSPPTRTYYTAPRVQYVKRFPPSDPPPPPTESRKTYTKVLRDELPAELQDKVLDLVDQGDAFYHEGPFPKGCYLLPEWVMWQYRQEIKDASDKLRRELDPEKLKQLDDATIYIPSA